ncbi:hypothetical protein BC830DRAFT_752696 [Chytriomyces sp. MP71]|nr:hypothetical protein BC830DRAFT_752696 [Chytriomyces sp. MP71]
MELKLACVMDVTVLLMLFKFQQLSSFILICPKPVFEMKPTGGVGGGFGQTGFSETERKRIDANLRKPLGPEYLATRAGPGGAKLSYIEGHRVISLAQEIFGFDGWSHSIVQTDIDFVDTARDGTAYSIGVSTIVRVTLKDGTSHEDVGYGYIENAKSKGMAFEKAKKESVTDGIKRALKSFGNALGNCVYDKRILMNIGKERKWKTLETNLII